MAIVSPTARRLILLSGLLLLPRLAAAQAVGARSGLDVNELQAELATLRGEVAALKAALADVQRALGVPAPGGQAGARVSPEMVEVLKSQVEEQAQVKVESASRMPVKVFGTILANTFVNSSDAIWLENPNFVGNPGATGPRGSMSATARQSRIGLETSGITVGPWQATGTMIADFYGGVTGFQTGTVMGLPRLLYAFGRLETDRTAIEIGQDHAILAPRDPTSLAALSFPLLYRSGNLYLRTPQVRIDRRVSPGVALSMGIVAPIAGDASTDYEFAPPAGAGERSMRPAFEGRLEFARGSSSSAGELAVGGSGHYGWRRTAAATTMAAWAAAVDFNVRAGRLGASGEFFAADNAEAFGAGISQSGRAVGGWLEGRFIADHRTTVAGGFGADRPRHALGRVTRQDNRTLFGTTIVQLTPELAASLEYRWMQTDLGLVPVTRRNHHVNAVFSVKF